MVSSRRVFSVLVVIALFLLLPCWLGAQTGATGAQTDAGVFPSQWAGAGLMWNNGVGADGLFAYAHKLTSNAAPTYSFTDVRITGIQGNPFVKGSVFRLLTAEETGVAQSCGAFGPARIYCLGSFGSSQTSSAGGTVVGNSLSAGGMAAVPLGRGWTVNPSVLWSKSSLANQQWQGGLLFGWGK